MKEKIYLLIDFVISMAIGALSYIFYFNQLIHIYFLGPKKLYNFTALAVFAGATLFVFIGIRLIRNKQLSPKAIKALYLFYFIVMIIMLFGRYTTVRKYNFDLQGSFAILNETIIFMALFNIVCFIPLGIWLKRFKFFPFLLIAPAIILSIESLQWITARGVFDIADILLNLTGILIGYVIGRLFNYVKTKSET